MGFFILKRDMLSLAMGLVMIFSLWMLMRHMLYSGEKEVAAGTAVNIVTEESEQTESDEGYLVVIDPGHGGCR